MKFSFCLPLLVALLMGCTQRAPKDIISKSKMEDILYDYFIAQSIASTSEDSITYKTRLYTDAVFEKYHISSTEFDSSMKYYSRHSDQLYDIFQNINKRFNTVLGKADYNSINNYAKDSDTITLWKGKSFNLLSSNGSNLLDFSIPDSLHLKENDKLSLIFNTLWSYPNSERSVICVLGVTLNNDTIKSVNRYFYNDAQMEISYYVQKQPIKRIEGTIFQNLPPTKELHQLFIINPRLVCIRNLKKNHPTDTIHEENNIEDQIEIID